MEYNYLNFLETNKLSLDKINTNIKKKKYDECISNLRQLISTVQTYQDLCTIYFYVVYNNDENKVILNIIKNEFETNIHYKEFLNELNNNFQSLDINHKKYLFNISYKYSKNKKRKNNILIIILFPILLFTLIFTIIDFDLDSLLIIFFCINFIIWSLVDNHRLNKMIKICKDTLNT